MMISAGFDAHAEDGMSGLLLREDDYRWITAELLAIAGEYGEGRTVSVLEGGYNLMALGRCVAAHINAMF